MGVDAFLESRAGKILLRRVLGYFDARLEGAHHLPSEGGALLVANHGLFGWDAFVLGALLAKHARTPWWLADKNMFSTPGFRPALQFAKAIPGAPEPAIELLRRGELVVVYPGGIFDSYKLSTDRHRLHWRGRSGFVKIAMRAGVPIVPIAACGVDDMYRVIAREPLLGRVFFGDDRYNLPLAFGRWGTLFPKKVPVVVHALGVVPTDGDVDDEASVQSLRDRVEGMIQQKLDAT